MGSLITQSFYLLARSYTPMTEMLGGKLLDKGSYGCVYMPSLLCKGSKKPTLKEDTDTDAIYPPITKIILKDAAEVEFYVSNIIRQIPLWKQYFAVSESICEPAMKQKEKEMAMCDAMEGHRLSDFRLLSMTYAGVPLNMHRFNLQTFDFLKFATHMIEAGALLNLFGIAHRDLHNGNILVDAHDVPRIIDFNLAITVESSITGDDIEHRYMPAIDQEPPDSTLVNAIAQGYKADVIIQSIVKKKTILKKIKTLFNLSNAEMAKQLEDYVMKSKSVKVGDLAGWFKTYWRTIDSWAIGMNLISMSTMLSTSPAFSKLMPLLRRLCSLSPIDRVDCVQALHYLEPTNSILKKYGKAWLAKVGDGAIH